MKKSLSLLLAILMCVSMIPLSGCNSKKENIPVPAATDSQSDISPPQNDGPDPGPKPDPEISDAQDEHIEPEPAGDDVVLVIYGSGVASQTNWTLEQLLLLEDGYLEQTFSTTNNWPNYSHIIGNGVALRYLLERAGILDDAKTLIFSSPDGYKAALTREQVFGVQYAYSEHSASGSSGAYEVEPVVAWEWGEKSAEPEDLRPFFGQFGPHDVNTAAMVKSLYRIEVSAVSAGAWDIPEHNIPKSGSLPKEMELEFTHPNMDNIKLYYTLDGSEPDYNSEVYNKSTSYFQPALILPVKISDGVTIKVFAGGFGKADSAVLTLTYMAG